jgi:hypothetical protein
MKPLGVVWRVYDPPKTLPKEARSADTSLYYNDLSGDRASYSVYRMTYSVYRMTYSVYRMTRSVYRMTRSVYRMTRSVYRMTRSVYRMTRSVYKMTRSVYGLPCPVFCAGAAAHAAAAGRCFLHKQLIVL